MSVNVDWQTFAPTRQRQWNTAGYTRDCDHPTTSVRSVADVTASLSRHACADRPTTETPDRCLTISADDGDNNICWRMWTIDKYIVKLIVSSLFWRRCLREQYNQMDSDRVVSVCELNKVSVPITVRCCCLYMRFVPSPLYRFPNLVGSTLHRHTIMPGVHIVYVYDVTRQIQI